VIFGQHGGAAFILLSGLVGTVIGSHLATVALRWPAGRSANVGRSMCDGCAARLRWWELVPLLSWLALRGRCHRCGGTIDWRHPATELAAGAIAILMATTLPSALALAGMVFGWALLLLSLLDLDQHWLPDRLTLPLLAAGLVLASLGIGPTLPARIIGAVTGWTVLEAVRRGYQRLRGRPGLGGGDPKLFAAIGAWTGWRMLPTTLLVASLTGLAIVALLTLAGRPIGRTTMLPFGPMLACGAVVAWIIVGQ
jgi:leader peptidase (prepilin peptidase)/N-methyltransferase